MKFPITKSLLLVVQIVVTTAFGAASSSTNPFELVGFVQINSGVQINLHDSAAKKSVWLKKGEQYNGWQFNEFKLPEGTAQFTSSEEGILILKLQEGSIKENRDAWIRSTANPMFFRAASLPRSISLQWNKLTTTEKNEIEALYKNYGWIINVIPRGPEHVTVTFDAVHESERRKAISEMFESFRKTLPPDIALKFDEHRKVRPLPTDISKLSPPAPPQTWLPRERIAAYEAMIATISAPPKYPTP